MPNSVGQASIGAKSALSLKLVMIQLEQQVAFAFTWRFQVLRFTQDLVDFIILHNDLFFSSYIVWQRPSTRNFMKQSPCEKMTRRSLMSQPFAPCLAPFESFLHIPHVLQCFASCCSCCSCIWWWRAFTRIFAIGYSFGFGLPCPEYRFIHSVPPVQALPRLLSNLQWPESSWLGWCRRRRWAAWGGLSLWRFRWSSATGEGRKIFCANSSLCASHRFSWLFGDLYVYILIYFI